MAGMIAGACGGSSSSEGGPGIKLASDAKLGTYVVSGSGRALYYFAKDLPASPGQAAVSNCSGQCIADWPVFHAASAVVEGVSPSDVAEIVRADGTPQTTYKGWPLYYFVGDAKAGQVNGEAVDNEWFVLHDRPYTIALLSKDVAPLYLTDGNGRSLYFFSKDTVGTNGAAPVSACTAPACAGTWPAFESDQPLVPSLLSSSDFTVFTRSDGLKQSAYKGHPLYFFSGDATPGDTKGKGVGGFWNTLDPTAL